MSYPERLNRELSAVGIQGALRRRIAAEITDHLACDPDAELGEPAALALQFADELGTRRALRAAFGAFAALVLAGALFLAALFALQRVGGFAVRIHESQPVLGTVGMLLSALGAQVALVAGGLGYLRALRRRHAHALSSEEARVLVRRASVGLAGGVVTFAGLVLTALGFEGHIAGWWTTLALCLAGAGTVTLAAAVPVALAAAHLHPRLAGTPGDLTDDLQGLLPARLNPGGWGFALTVACVVVLAISLAGIVQNDPYDGLLRGLADGAASMAGYIALGRYLGLRRIAYTADPA